MYGNGMILQPILENSIAHGLIKKLGMPESDARIILKAYLLGPETVCFSIWDNGTGIDEKRIDDIMLSKYVSGSDSEHIGIRNIQDRIHYEFGENFNISIESVLGEFTEVKIYLPKISKEEIS